jgi:hypothetical protein
LLCKDTAVVFEEELAELVAGVGQDASRGDLIGLAGDAIALERDVVSAEGSGGDRGGQLEQEQRTERRFGVQAGGRGQARCPPTGRHGHRSLRVATTCWTETAACPAAAAAESSDLKARSSVARRLPRPISKIASRERSSNGPRAAPATAQRQELGGERF